MLGSESVNRASGRAWLLLTLTSQSTARKSHPSIAALTFTRAFIYMFPTGAHYVRAYDFVEAL